MVMKPNNFTMIEAASITYAGLTAWTGLQILEDLVKFLMVNMFLSWELLGVLVSMAIQLAKIWGSKVIIQLYFSSCNHFFFQVN